MNDVNDISQVGSNSNNGLYIVEVEFVNFMYHSIVYTLVITSILVIRSNQMERGKSSSSVFFKKIFSN